MRENIFKILDQFRNRRVMIIGDIIIDRYVWGEVSRISPEAPVPIVKVLRQNYVPGGAANTANNVAALAGKAYMVGIVGNDGKGRLLKDELIKRGIDFSGVLTDEERPTIQKVRIIGQNQQLLRVDYEAVEDIDRNLEERVLEYISKNIKGMDTVVVSDYAKGLITNNLMRSIISMAKDYGKFVIVDPKSTSRDMYKGSDLITPNHKEAAAMSGLNSGDINEIGNVLLRQVECNILITRGERGMTLFEKSGKVTHIPTKAKEVYDVSGAGDTVVGALALAVAAGASLIDASKISNVAAGIVVGKVGTATATIQEIKENWDG